MTNKTIEAITKRVIERSKPTREQYVARMQAQAEKAPRRMKLACGNLAHGFAACDDHDKKSLRSGEVPNIAIVSSYNDMLSAHKPFEEYPDIIRNEAHKHGAVAQFAGATPAMCDGVTQGQPGMDLSLFSRDVIAMSTAIALSHDMFDAALMLGICDKIVPGLLIGALSFGHLPTVFVPGGPMTSGLPNKEKARIRQLFAEGKIGREELLDSESASYHGEGTCTFYGTANSNQMMMEMMGLQLPGSSFVNPHTPLREALTRAATRQALALSAVAGEYLPLWQIVDEKAIINAMVGLNATGGSTNHTIHLIAMAKAAGIQINWSDFAETSDVTPLFTRIYPNGSADVNHFHAAGGMGFLMKEMLGAGLLHGDIKTVTGKDLHSFAQEPYLDNSGKAIWKATPEHSLDETVLRPASNPFSATGGTRLMEGNIGRGVMKVSAVAEEHQVVEAPARVFTDQNHLIKAFKDGNLTGDFVAVITHEGPAACGMPELHKLTPPLGVLQDMGFKVALVTDGRMSGASGKVPAAIHITPEAVRGGVIAKIRDGDIVRVDGKTGELTVKVPAEELAAREPSNPDISAKHHGMGRELFAPMRHAVTQAEDGASFLGLY
ncbi:MAG: phosphogluconate dehydratase [Alphaproteobacteria bacterium]|nr:phosphogluconate dehydratase [Alphaproteobacteria bacterium]